MKKRYPDLRPAGAGRAMVPLLLALVVTTGCDPTAPDLLDGRIILAVQNRIHQVGTAEDQVLPMFSVTVEGGVQQATRDEITGMTVVWPDGTETPIPLPLTRGEVGFTAEAVEERRPGPPPNGVYQLRVSFRDDRDLVVERDHRPAFGLGRVEFLDFQLETDVGPNNVGEARLMWRAPRQEHSWEALIVRTNGDTAVVISDGVRGATSAGGRISAGLGFDLDPGATYAFRVVLENAWNVRIADFPFDAGGATLATD